MKDYANWHNKKTAINEIEPRPFFHKREIWYCAIGVNVGFNLSQIRLVDARRLDHKIGDIKEEDFEKLTKKFKELLP